MVSIVAVVIVWEHKLKNETHILIHIATILCFEFKQVMEWMVQIDISLQDLMAFNEELILLEWSDSIIIQTLLVFNNELALIALGNKIIDHDSL